MNAMKTHIKNALRFGTEKNVRGSKPRSLQIKVRQNCNCEALFNNNSLDVFFQIMHFVEVA